MRFLPDNPSLDFLRQEAKDLLAALREYAPDASLADAQRALAGQYGLRDWAELRSEAQRRAAQPPVPPAGLAEALAARFGLGSIVRPAAPVSFTPMGRCWSMTTDRGRWLAGTVYPWITEHQAEVGAGLRDAAVAAGIVAPSPVRSPSGRLVETVDDRSWRIHVWIEMGPSPVTPTSAAVARRVGATYGILHSLAIPSRTPVNPYLTSRRSDAEWDALLDRARAADKPWADRLADFLPVAADLGTIDGDIDREQFILCNSNLIPENVRTGHHGQLVVTEWDFAGSLTPELELGSALSHWIRHPTVNRPALTAFRDGYAEVTGGWPAMDIASFAVAVTGWLNWAHATICEAIDPANADHAAFAEREANDLLTMPMTRAGLEDLLDPVTA